MKSPSEYEEAVTFSEYLTLKGYLFSHIPSETYSEHWGVKMRNKRMGVHKGVPDYLILVKDKIVFLELKRRLGKQGGKNGTVVSPEQRVWLTELAKRGAETLVAYGAGQAIEYIEKL